MPRKFGDLEDGEKEAVVAAVHREAEEAGWHQLSHQAKGALYDRWAREYDLGRQVLKDRIMKGFDVAQGVAPTGEAAIHQEMVELLKGSSVPYWESKVVLWNGRAQADFAFGFSRRFLTHTVELESAVTWRTGLMQALWYKSAYFQESCPDIQWVESYVAADKTFCVYLAKDQDIIKKHAEISGFPATKITEIGKMIDPTTEHGG